MRLGDLKVFVTVALSLFGTGAFAQDEDVLRAPSSGIPILDCAPQAPVPSETCILRLPPLYALVDLQSDPLGAEKGEFRLAKPGRINFPDNLSLSATLLLVDLSPGPVSPGRRTTFDREKDLMSAMVRALPADEEIAVYGFNQSLRLLSDFTSDRGATLATIEDLSLDGSNTRIGTFVEDGIDILAEKEGVLLRNLVLVSDGEEEGLSNPEDVAAKAISEDVVVSAIGTFWRGFGTSENAIGMDYLDKLSRETLGSAVQAQLDRPDQASERVDAFAAGLANAITASGLIMPVGAPQASTITVVLDEPVLGAPGRFTQNEISATFRPPEAEATDASDATPPAPAEPQLFGFPATYVYAGIGGFIALLALILLLSRRKREPEIVELDLPDDDDFPEPAPQKSAAPASAYLVFEDGNRRAGISGEKVSVGRSASNDVVIDLNGVSRLHAQIYRNREGGYSIADMDSLNGTYINDGRVSGTQPVRLGDRITFGKITAKLVSA